MNEEATMKTYALEVRELCEFEGGHMGWWSKGWHDAGAFVAWLPDAADPFPIREGLEPFVRHEYWRCVPVGTTGVNRGSLLIKARPHTRGAFPVTVVED